MGIANRQYVPAQKIFRFGNIIPAVADTMDSDISNRKSAIGNRQSNGGCGDVWTQARNGRLRGCGDASSQRSVSDGNASPWRSQRSRGPRAGSLSASVEV